MRQPARLESVNCPLCGQSSNRRRLQSPDVLNDRNLFNIVECLGCGFCYTNPRPPENEIHQWYPATYEPYVMADARRERLRSRLRRSLTKDLMISQFGYPSDTKVDVKVRLKGWLARLWIRRGIYRCQWIPYRAPGRLLDFGCGAGEFLRTMQDLGWCVQGVDASARMAELVGKQHGIQVHNGSLPHPELKPGTFDVVTMWQALEHVHDPRMVIGAARVLLRPGGLLIVAVPDFGGLGSRLFGPDWYGIQLPLHLSHFNRRTLVRLIEKEGFVVSSTRSVAMDDWVRRSARTCKANAIEGAIKKVLRIKPAAILFSNVGEWLGHGENLVVCAERG